MELSKEIKDKIRIDYAKKILDYYIGTGRLRILGKIKMPKEDLEDLLFDIITFKGDKKTYVIKLPVWSGPFLEAIDLSEVDFSDVSWNLLGRDVYDPFINALTEYYNKRVEYLAYIKKIHDSFISFRTRLTDSLKLSDNMPFLISFCNTNAQIDLSQSFEAKHFGCIEFSSCDFHDFNFIDFSQYSVSPEIKYYEVISSNLSGSNITFDNTLFAKNSNLDGIDLSSKKIDASGFFDRFDNGYNLPNCSLRDTGTQIVLESNKFKFNKNSKANKDLNENLRRVIQSDMWAGCFINGKRFNSCDERAKQKVRYKKDIDNMTSSKINKLISCIKL